MKVIGYPSKGTDEIYEVINSNLLKMKVIKLRTLKNNNLVHSFLNSVSKEYQNQKEELKKGRFE